MAKHIRVACLSDTKKALHYHLHALDDSGKTVLRFDSDRLKDVFNKVVELNLPFCANGNVVYEWIKGGYPRELLLVPDMLSGFVDNIYKAKDSLNATRIGIHKDFISISHCQRGKDIYHMPLHVMYYAFTGHHLKDRTYANKSFETDYEAFRFIIQALEMDETEHLTEAEQAACDCYYDYREAFNSISRSVRYKKMLSLNDKGVYVLCTGGSWVYAPGKTQEEAEEIYMSLADSTSQGQNKTSVFG